MTTEVSVKSYFRVGGLPASRWGAEAQAKPVKRAEIQVLASGKLLAGGSISDWGTGSLNLKDVADGQYSMLVKPQAAQIASQAAGPGLVCAGDAAYRELNLSVTVKGREVTTAGLANPGDIHGSAMMIGKSLSIDLKPVWWRCKGVSRKRSVNAIIIHHTGTASIGPAMNSFGGSVAPHYVLDVDGFVVKTVDCTMAAAHAGYSCWKGVVGLNDTTIGVEIIHEKGPYPEAQYTSLLALLEELCKSHKIPKHHVIGHQDVATSQGDQTLLDPRRAADPGPEFDWAKLTSAGFGLQLNRAVSDPTKIYDGAFAPITASHINKAKPPNKLSPKDGSKKAISELQDDLDAIGFSVKKTGTYDKHTVAAVKHFELHFNGRSQQGGASLQRETAIKIKRCCTW